MGLTQFTHMGDFFNSPTVHFYRNVFSHVPRSKMRQVSAMLKAIHAQESREAALEKAGKVVDDLKSMRLGKAAELVEQKISETLTYYVSICTLMEPPVCGLIEPLLCADYQARTGVLFS